MNQTLRTRNEKRHGARCLTGFYTLVILTGLAGLCVACGDGAGAGRHLVSVAVDPDAECARAFSLEAMPSSYLIDPGHVVREVHLGFRPGGTVRMRESIEAMLPAPVAR